MVIKKEKNEGEQKDKIIHEDINKEMRSAYLNYSMSVITARALPDVRDGLKPVHRRILFSMNDMGIHANTKTKKSARIVGNTLGKFHPHGDSAVYEAMVRLTQDFKTRYPLVIGQGNFGSIDGDNAAAPRYTEAKLSKISDEMLNKNTVIILTWYRCLVYKSSSRYLCYVMWWYICSHIYQVHHLKEELYAVFV